MKILVVDDEQIVLTSVRRLLRRRGMTDVEIFDNGKDAVKKFFQRISILSCWMF